jgi:hypothetical protein
MRKASFDRRLDEVGREEGEGDCHVDLADAAAVARRDACRIRREIRELCLVTARPLRRSSTRRMGGRRRRA